MKQANVIDPQSLSITDEPFPGRQLREGSKYEGIFSAVRQGQRIKCPEGTAPRLAASFKKWLERNGHKNPQVRAVNYCADGFGGVW